MQAAEEQQQQDEDKGILDADEQPPEPGQKTHGTPFAKPVRSIIAAPSHFKGKNSPAVDENFLPRAP